MKKEREPAGSLRADNSFGTAAVVLGILSIVLSSLGGIILGVIGMILASKQRRVMQTSWASWGFWLSAVGVLLSVIILVYGLIQLCTLAGTCANIPSYIQQVQLSPISP
ncbi:hypothetical protein HYZ97_04450 [Candidatus Pacearchaeota archaeon]|nr:hypothetical protein [Candidatus Pacearchaeota archaeon]